MDTANGTVFEIVKTGLNNAAAALGYPSVRALQKAILEFCEPDEAAEHRKREDHQSEQLD